MPQWFENNEKLLAWIGILSLAVLVASLFLTPFLVARIPADYFAKDEPPPSAFAEHHPAARIALLIARNVIGALLILAGIAMLLLPGQGILTLLFGLFVVDFPGKRKLELRLLRRPRILRTLNWMRKRAGREPLRVAGARSDERAQSSKV